MNSLTDVEKKWVKQMEKALKDMPARLVMIEAADAMFLMDRAVASVSEINDGIPEREGKVLHRFKNGTFKIMGTIA